MLRVDAATDRGIVRAKICGMTNVDDAMNAADAGADFLGYIFYPKSLRYIEPSDARVIMDVIRVSNPQVKHVGVFVDEEPDTVRQAAETAGLDIIQLHGNESPEYCQSLTGSGFQVMKALRFGTDAAPVNPSDYPTDLLLCDTYDKAAAGGTGQVFNHDLLPPDLPLERTFIAGGLTPENVSAVIKSLRPYAVDVSSGVELSPGIKSQDLVELFLQRVRETQGS